METSGGHQIPKYLQVFSDTLQIPVSAALKILTCGIKILSRYCTDTLPCLDSMVGAGLERGWDDDTLAQNRVRVDYYV